MTDADEDDGQRHVLTREVVATREEALDLDGDGGLEPVDPGDGVLVDFDEKATLECSCDERFRKESTVRGVHDAD